jgi:hypothetical protein
MRKISLFFVMLLLTGCQSMGLFISGDFVIDKQKKSLEVTAESYARDRKDKAVVLFDVNWGRLWGCAGYENVRLLGFQFDRLPMGVLADDAPADITVANANLLLVERRFLNYAILIPPGEYALTAYTTRFAAKVDSIGYWGMYRSDFPKRKLPHGGTFKVAAGETVYIGNFYLDCYRPKDPIIWRYYTEEKYMAQQIKEYQDKYPFLDLSKVIYRLFDTKVFGRAPEGRVPGKE